MQKIPVNEPVITEAAKRYVNDALDTGWISSAGSYIQEFEEEFADYLGVGHAITTTSGTTALHLALVTLGIGPGDEVILPDFTMIASVDAILYTGATPVVVDVDPKTFTMDMDAVANAITDRTRAVMPVHIYGHSADMDPLMELSMRHGFAILENAAEAHGAKYKGRMCGSMGTINAFSFYGNKIITTGEGGMVVTDDDEIAARARSLRDLAHSLERRFWHEEVGYNYRMTNMQAAVGAGQLEAIEVFLDRKRSMARRYGQMLADVPGLQLPVTKEWAENVYWMYAILVEDAFPLTRDELRAELQKRGIDTRDFFYPLHQMPLMAPYVRRDQTFPVTDDIAQRGFYLPSGLAITDAQIDAVCDAIRDIAHVS